MTLRRSNVTINTSRLPAMNNVTKHTGVPVAYLTSIPAMVRDAASDTRAGPLATLYDLSFIVDITVDIVGGDYITGYNPANQSPAPVYIVNHVEYKTTPTGGLDARKVWVKVVGGKSP